MKKLIYLCILFFVSQQTLTAQYSANYAGSFNGFNSYAAFPNSADFNPVGAITLEAWVNPTSLIGNTMAVIGKNYQTSYFLGIQTSGRVVFYPRGGQSFRSRVNSVIQANKWTHIAATFDGSLAAIYINGVLDTSSTGYSGAIGVNTDSLFIGADRIGANPSLFFYGKLDNVRLWAIARNAFVISEHRYIPLEVFYPTGYYSDLRLSVQLDGDLASYSGNNFYTGFNRNVTFTNYSNKGVNYLDYNNSLVLNGISDYFSASWAASAGFNPTTGITLETWIRRDTTGTQPGVQNLLNKSGGTTRYNYGLLLYSSGAVLFALNSEGFTLGSPALITNGQWTHVAATYSSSTGRAVIYINGDSVAGSTYSGNPLIQSDNDAVYIGGIGASNYSSNRFKGQIDGVRIWNYQRTRANIKENMYKAPPPSVGLTFFNFDKYTNAIYSSGARIFTTTTFAGLSHISSSHLGKIEEKTSPMLSDVAGGYYSPGFTTSSRRFFVPDASAIGIRDSLFISSGGDVSNLKVFLLMNHTYLSDLEVLLISPAGSAISLFNRRAGSGDDIMTIFSDGADSNASLDNNLNSPGITAPFSPSIKPVGQLSFLNGQNKFGWWKLKLIDHAGGDYGYVHGWG
ncbi:MAG: LamG-like jellyroll fold domain-containing protein, partial [bacterium]